ncbi:fimbrillin family protein [Phocaeicola sartorii]|uniref:fimbrillin family protein n=1 Tax=Phocaeicola sartorii TaxID=671267 RepID=UPI00242FEBDB|nr:fimbrillin family protein [Phocaeicola sartorii]
MINKSNPFRHLAVAVFACLMAASCSDVTDDGTALPDGKYPMTFTASVDGLSVPNPASRATTDADGKTSWTVDDPVAISMDGGANHKVYKISDAGTGAMIPDGETLYWSKQQENLAAWYPVNYIIGNGGGSEVNITDQSSGFGTLENILHAPAQDYTYSNGGSVAFTFRHALAKVKVALKKGDGIEESDLSNATVTFTGYTAGSLGYDGMTGSEGSNGEITPKTETSSGGAVTYTALVIPQQMQGKKFIKVTITMNGVERDYYYTPAGSTDANLEGGKQYNYTITVKKTGLQVESVTASWNDNAADDDAENATFKIHLDAFSAPENTSNYAVTDANGSSLTAINNIYTTSSSAINISLSAEDGYTLKKFLTKVTAGICKQKAAYTADTRTYTYTFYDIRSDLWLDGIQAEAETVGTSLPTLNVGDYYYVDGTWSSTLLEKPCIGIVFKVGASGNDQPSNYEGNKPSDIHGYVVALQDALSTAGNWGTRKIETPIANVDNASVTTYTGYSDTKTIISTYSGGSTWNDYQAFKAVVDYRSSVPAPGTSSDWYLPSLAQLGDVYNALSTIGVPLGIADAAFQTENDSRYWTSSEQTNYGYDAWYIKMNNGTKESYAKDGTNYSRACYARAILTF